MLSRQYFMILHEFLKVRYKLLLLNYNETYQHIINSKTIIQNTKMQDMEYHMYNNYI